MNPGKIPVKAINSDFRSSLMLNAYFKAKNKAIPTAATINPIPRLDASIIHKKTSGASRCTMLTRDLLER